MSFLITFLLPFILAYLYLRLWQKPSYSRDFGPRFTLARTVFETLKDDIAPKRTLTGWLDLTGLRQPSKRVKERISAFGMPVSYYRDEWLRMKAPLYDGSLLRVSAVEQAKARLGRWKTSARGRRKWKPGGLVQDREILRLSIVPNPQTQRLAMDLPVISFWNSKIGRYVVQSFQVREGRLECVAVSSANIDASDILQMMRYIHQFIELKLPA